MSAEYAQEEEYLKKGLELSAQLKANLSPLIDPFAISKKTKIPSKAVCLREVLLHRVSELAEAALTCYQKDQLVASAILTRAILESFAVFDWFFNELECSVSEQSSKKIDEFLKRALVGTRNKLIPVDAH